VTYLPQQNTEAECVCLFRVFLGKKKEIDISQMYQRRGSTGTLSRRLSGAIYLTGPIVDFVVLKALPASLIRANLGR